MKITIRFFLSIKLLHSQTQKEIFKIGLLLIKHDVQTATPKKIWEVVVKVDTKIQMLGQVFGRVDRRDDERGFDNMSDRPINK
jgi:hypothetical protein